MDAICEAVLYSYRISKQLHNKGWGAQWHMRVMKMNNKNRYIGMSLYKEWVNVFDGPPSHLGFLI